MLLAVLISGRMVNISYRLAAAASETTERTNPPNACLLQRKARAKLLPSCTRRQWEHLLLRSYSLKTMAQLLIEMDLPEVLPARPDASVSYLAD